MKTKLLKEIQTQSTKRNQFINFIRDGDHVPKMIQSSRGYTVVNDTVSCKSGGKRGPEMIMKSQGEVKFRSCPYSPIQGSKSEGYLSTS